MTTDTEVKPLTADEAKEAFASLPESVPQRIYEGLSRIATRDHRTYDTATHAAVPHEELERLRADARRLAAVPLMIGVDIICEIDLHESACQFACEAGREEPNESDYLQAMRCAIDAAQQEEGDA